MKIQECRYCGSKKFELEDRGVHKAVMCGECGKYLKFATKEETYLLSRVEKLEPPKPTIDTDDFKEEVKMSFGRAFNLINNPVTNNPINNPVTRDMMGMRLPHWKEDVIIKIQFPDEHSKMTTPYLYVESRFGRVPWIPTQIELFSREWVIVYGC